MKNSKEKNENKNKKKTIVIFMLCIIILSVILIPIIVTQIKKEDLHRKLINVFWENKSGDTFMFYPDKTCYANLQIKQYDAIGKVSNCTYEIKDNIIFVDFVFSYTSSNGMSNSGKQNFKFKHNDDMSELRLFDYLVDDEKLTVFTKQPY